MSGFIFIRLISFSECLLLITKRQLATKKRFECLNLFIVPPIYLKLSTLLINQTFKKKTHRDTKNVSVPKTEFHMYVHCIKQSKLCECEV